MSHVAGSGYHRFKLPPAAASVQAACVYCGAERTLAADARRLPFWLRNRPPRRRSIES